MRLFSIVINHQKRIVIMTLSLLNQKRIMRLTVSLNLKRLLQRMKQSSYHSSRSFLMLRMIVLRRQWLLMSKHVLMMI